MQSTLNKTYPGACDCHVHIYEDKFPLLPDIAWVPTNFPVSSYRKVQESLGLDRSVIVQPTGYGIDNSCTLDALKQLGQTARGIAVIAPETTDDELQRLHEAGIRGARFMMIGGILGWEYLNPMADRLAEFNWMINLQLDGHKLPDHENVLKRLPCMLVIDHNGKFLEPVSPNHPAFQSLLRILDSGKVWIKLSAPYETSKYNAPTYDDVSLLARTLAENFPERCLWASNWPHPKQNPPPSNVDLYELLFSWATSDATRQKILDDNPAILYDYS